MCGSHRCHNDPEALSTSKTMRAPVRCPAPADWSALYPETSRIVLDLERRAWARTTRSIHCGASSPASNQAYCYVLFTYSFDRETVSHGSYGRRDWTRTNDPY